MSSAPELRCPGCGAEFGPDDRFCERCALPLVPVGEPPQPGPAAQRARKILPQFADGPPVRVARAQNQPEAEMIEQLLLDAGIPCLVRRAPGADVPDFLAAGARDVLVPSSGAEAAREALKPAAP
jgi:pimeloyl-ACP methyl ester carboxylesterase